MGDNAGAGAPSQDNTQPPATGLPANLADFAQTFQQLQALFAKAAAPPPAAQPKPFNWPEDFSKLRAFPSALPGIEIQAANSRVWVSKLAIKDTSRYWLPANHPKDGAWDFISYDRTYELLDSRGRRGEKAAEQFADEWRHLRYSVSYHFLFGSCFSDLRALFEGFVSHNATSEQIAQFVTKSDLIPTLRRIEDIHRVVIGNLLRRGEACIVAAEGSRSEVALVVQQQAAEIPGLSDKTAASLAESRKRDSSPHRQQTRANSGFKPQHQQQSGSGSTWRPAKQLDNSSKNPSKKSD